jgi:hypothetical protein
VPDTHPPHVAQVISSTTNLAGIVLKFNEDVNPTEAGDYINYVMSGNIGVTFAMAEVDGQTVTLALSDLMVAGDTYQLEISNVRDLSDITINPNPTSVSFVAGSFDQVGLAIARSGNDVTLSWPASATGFTLEQTAQLVTPPAVGVWTAVPTAPTVINGRNTVSVGAGTGTQMFRLRQ